jgi:hypothetical protein
MTHDNDPLLEALARLQPVAPRTEWEARVRARCHVAIAGRGSRRNAGIVDFVAFAALGFYLAAMLTEAARVGGFLQ